MVSFTKLPRCTPAQAGIAPKWIRKMIDDYARQGLQINSFLLVRHGQVCCEGYYAPYSPTRLQTVYSLSKTFTSMAVGIAADEGRIDLDARVVDVFADAVQRSGVTPDEAMRTMTLRHLLRMSTGQLKEPGWFHEISDIPAAFFTVPCNEAPGQVFRYNSIATYMLSSALKKNGIDLEDYLQEKLLTPLGVHGTRWQRDCLDTCTGGIGLSLVPELIAKLGVCILQNGQWEGRQLIPASYLALATTKQISNAAATVDRNSDWQAGYGYQMWMCKTGAFRGDGMYGQLCVMDRRTDTVLAMTALLHNIQAELNVYWEDILAHYEPNPLPEDAAETALLNAKLKPLRHDRPLLADDGSPVPDVLLNRAFTLPNIGKLCLRQTDKGIIATVGDIDTLGGRGCYITNYQQPFIAPLRMRDMSPTLMLCTYAMQNGIFSLRMFSPEMLEELTLTLTPDKDAVTISLVQTTNPDAPEPRFTVTQPLN